jgi:hypothetical protein
VIAKKPPLKTPREEKARDERTDLRDEAQILLDLIEKVDCGDDDGKPRPRD